MGKSKKIISTLGSYAGYKSIHNPLSIPEFESTWKTDNVGTSGDNQISLPLEITGTYDFAVSWGDGSSDTITVWNQAETTHTYASAGTYTVKITGTIKGWRFNNVGDKLKILTIENWCSLLLDTDDYFFGGNYFYGCANLVVNATDTLDLSSVTDLRGMFRSCSSIVNLDVSSWDVSSVTTLKNMFYGCSSLTYVNVSNWNVGNVTDMEDVFWGCSSINNINVGSWDISSVTILRCAFANCSSLTDIDVSGWNLVSVVNLGDMFYGCSSLTEIDVSSWNVSNVTNFSYIFSGCTLLTTIDVSSWNVSSALTFDYIFHNCISLTFVAVNNWNITSVTNMLYMFYGVTLMTVCYDAILIAWEGQAVQNGVSFHGGSSKYTGGGAAEAARTALIGDHTWTITDGGSI